MLLLQSLGAKGLLIVLAHVVDLYDNETYPQTIPVALIGQTSKDILVVNSSTSCQLKPFFLSIVSGMTHITYNCQ